MQAIITYHPNFVTDSISCPLSKIINQTLCTGIFPSKLKLAKVIPLYKKNDEKEFGNYRLISLLSSLWKIFEKVAFAQLYDYLSLHGLLFDGQYGFRKHHSTELTTSELTDRIRHEIDQKKVPFSVYLNLSKGFDTLNHDVLLIKLKYYGIKNTPLDCFRSYLTQRLQYVEFDGTASSTTEKETGLRQGSIFGPLLFIIYINDIHKVSTNLKFILYADNTTIRTLCSFTHGGNDDISLVAALISLAMCKISDWLAVNKLSLNVQKTKFMIVHNYQRVISANEIPNLIIF